VIIGGRLMSAPFLLSRRGVMNYADGSVVMDQDIVYDVRTEKNRYVVDLKRKMLISYAGEVIAALFDETIGYCRRLGNMKDHPDAANEFTDLLQSDPKFNYSKDEFLDWMVDCVLGREEK